jgi:hypothetical protein
LKAGGGPKPVSTMAHCEFVLGDRDAGERVVVQVKSDGAWIEASQFAGEQTARPFSALVNYGSTIPQNVAIIYRPSIGRS